MKKLNSLAAVFLLILAALTSACAPQISDTLPTPNVQQVPPPGEKFLCVLPESDNGLTWDNSSRVCYDTQAYTLRVQVAGDLSSNQTVNGTTSGTTVNGIGSVSGKIWTEGKGILPVWILSMSPSAEWVNPSLPYLLKTTDLKAMGVPVGATIELVCTHDVEVSSPSFSGQTLTTDRITNELDNCRLKTGNYTP